MEREQFNAIIKECLEDHDVLITKGEELVASYNAQIEALDELKNENELLKEKNDELRKECQKWMSRSVFNSSTPEEDEKDDYETLTKKLKEKLKGN